LRTSYEELFNTAILGFALTEALGLFALMMALIFLYAKLNWVLLVFWLIGSLTF
jgi:hypothetical protein